MQRLASVAMIPPPPITLPKDLLSEDWEWLARHAELAGTAVWHEPDWPVIPIQADPALVQYVLR